MKIYSFIHVISILNFNDISLFRRGSQQRVHGRRSLGGRVAEVPEPPPGAAHATAGRRGPVLGVL